MDQSGTTRHSGHTPGGGRGLQLAFVASGVLALAFHLVTVRVLDAASYAQVATAAGLAAVAAVPLGAVQTAAARMCAHGPLDARPAFAQVRRLAVIIALVSVALGPLLGPLLSIGSWAAAGWLGVWAAVNVLGGLGKGLLLGRFAHREVAVGLLVGSAVRVAVAIPLGVHFGAVGAIAATAVGEAASYPIYLYALRRRGHLTGGAAAGAVHLESRELTRISFASAGLWALSAGLLTSAGHVLNSAAVGTFSLTASLAGAGLFLPAGRAAVAVPDLAGADSGPVLQGLVRWSVAFAALSTVAAAAVGPVAVPVVFGSGHRPGVVLTALLAGGYGLLGIATVGVTTLLARRAGGAGIGWLMTAVFGVGVTATHLVVGVGPLMLAGLAAATAGVLAFVAVRRAVRAVREADRDVVPAAAATGTLSVILPAFEVGDALAPTVARVFATVEYAGIALAEVIVVDDGSTDGAPQRLPARPGLQLVTKPNGGKGSALTAGTAASTGDVVVFLDSDGDIDPAHIVPLYEAVTGGATVAYGHRADSDQSMVRHLSSGGYRMLVRTLFSLPVKETQCGAKAFVGDCVRGWMPRVRTTGFCFDVELLALAAKDRSTFVPVPVTVERTGASSVGLRTVFDMFIDTVRLRVRGLA